MFGFLSHRAAEDDFRDPSTSSFPYHPDAVAYVSPSGFLGRLKRSEYEALDELKTLVKEKKIDLSRHLNPPAETEDHFLLRFLRARHFNVDKAYAMMKDNIEWRIRNQIPDILTRRPEDLHQCDKLKLREILPVFISGFDKQGRPVMWKKMGDGCDIYELSQHTEIENLVKFHWYCQERMVRLCAESSEKTGYAVETMTIITDAAGWSLKLLTKTALYYLKGLADTDSVNYPERMGCVWCINCPSALAFAWNIISGWLDPVTQKKVRFLKGPAEYEEALREIMDPEVIPTQYGGTLKVEPWQWGALAGLTREEMASVPQEADE